MLGINSIISKSEAKPAQLNSIFNAPLMSHSMIKIKCKHLIFQRNCCITLICDATQVLRKNAPNTKVTIITNPHFYGRSGHGNNNRSVFPFVSLMLCIHLQQITHMHSNKPIIHNFSTAFCNPSRIYPHYLHNPVKNTRH